MSYRDRRLARADRLREWAEKRAARSSGNFTRAHNLIKDIPFGQPILVGHHSERRHRRTLERSDAAMRRGVEDERKAGDMASRAASIEDAAERAIYRDDVDAIERLQAKIAKLEAERDTMKRANAIVRKRGLDTAAKVAQLAELMKCKPETAAKLLEPDFCGRIGFAPYELSNRGGVITRERKRLAELTADRTASGAAIVAPDAGAPLERAGLVITATMTTPAKSWKQPRPVWNVSGNLAHWRPALVEQLGGSWYRGTVSFFEDPTETISAAIVEAEHAAHAAADPHCTCNDCIADLDGNEAAR